MGQIQEQIDTMASQCESMSQQLKDDIETKVWHSNNNQDFFMFDRLWIF